MAEAARAELPNLVLQTVFPPGGQAATTVTVTVDGAALDGLRDIRSTIPHLIVKKADTNRFTLTLPAGTPPGVYELRAVATHGMSSPRAFFVSNRAELLEKEPNDATDTAQHVPLDVVVNGRIDKPGDVDCYRFDAKSGQRVVLECWARRIDSQLRAVLELYDAAGKRLAVNRGHAGLDPLIDFLVPSDGTYFVKVFDLSFLGGATHFYRLDIDTKPRVEFALPCVVERGKSTRVKLFGRNLSPRPFDKKQKAESDLPLDCVEVEITPPRAGQDGPIPLPLSPAQIAADVFPYHYPGGHAPVLIGVSDVPVIAATADNHLPDHAQEIAVPSTVSGQLTDGDERHWYAVRARRGEVFWLEAFGERIGSPVELGVAVLDPSGQRELMKLSECLDKLGESHFPTAHSDPAGRWVAPADGRYLIVVRNRIGGLDRDPRRVYQLSIRREEPDFQLAVVSRRTDQPATLNVGVGGREMVEVLAIRRRGLTGPIRVSAEKLPSGIECPDIWIGPGQDHAPLVLTAVRDCPSFAGALHLVGHADIGGATITRPARGGTIVWAGQPMPSVRLTQEIPLATAPPAKALLTATPGETVIDQESVLDVAIDVEQRFEGAAGPIHLSGVGLPCGVANAAATIPAGKTKGHISFFFPESLSPGPYTFAVQAETLLPAGKVSVRLVSNPITVTVRPARHRSGNRSADTAQDRPWEDHATALHGGTEERLHRQDSHRVGGAGGRRRIAGSRRHAGRPNGVGRASDYRHGNRSARPATLPAAGGRRHRGGSTRLPGRSLCGAGDYRMRYWNSPQASGAASARRSLHRRADAARLARMIGACLALLAVASCCAAAERTSSVYFNTDVVPILTKLGCNSGGCHGKATGQNGFKLSLLGYEPDLDYEALVQEARGRRVFPAVPERSLLLLKATGVLAHGGGKRLQVGSEDYQTLLRWIEIGAPSAHPSDPVLTRITVAPDRQLFEAGVRRQSLRVTAHFSDGAERDVTRQAGYQVNEPDLAEVSDAGLVQAKDHSGLFAVMVRYADQIAVFHGTVPSPRKGPATAARLDAWEKANAHSDVDRLLAAQWKRLGVTPSAPADDAAFIRRATLDICGTLPTPDEVSAYTTDPRPDKRARLIDRLLDRPEYASFFALKWGDILRNRGRGYSTSQQRPGTALFASWIRDSIADNMPYDRFVSEILTASGSQETNPPTVWYRTVRTTPDYVESVAQAFLGIRIQCAQCHHHPAEQLEPGRLLPTGRRLCPRGPQGRLRRCRGADGRDDLPGRRGRGRSPTHRPGDAAAPAGRSRLRARRAMTTRAAVWRTG